MNGPGVFLVSSIFWLRDESLEESDWGRSGRLRSRFKPFNAFKPLKAFEGSENLRDPEAVAQEIVKLQAAARSRDGDIVETCCSKCFSPQVFSSSQIKNLRVDQGI